MVRAQGGTEAAVRLGLFSRDFYAGQQRAARHRLGLRRAGLLHAVLLRARGRRGARADRHAAGARPRRALGRARRVRRAEPGDGARADPGWRRTPPGDGYIDPPRNVLAYTAALFTPGVRVRRAHRVHRSAAVDGGRVTGVRTTGGRRSRPSASCSPAARRWPRSGRAAGVRIPAGGARHQVVVTEAAPRPRGRPAADGLRRGVRDLLAARGGRRAVGDEQPRRAAGRGRPSSTGRTTRGCAARMATLLPDDRGRSGLRKAWAATIDFTPDHLPILGPADRRRRAGRRAPSSPPPAATG